ncbi:MULTISPECIES: hypothetical protein [unclassified Lysobacter]|uniref:SMP-30/gluconolactonase/LRE family protein n=1 Tax=unclassified Lysobacter TaxID=2635362 RepID=UPI001BE64006|nr:MULTISPECIES: hypothetical protein [unclassified Lysobacter]MBT2744899.1 hypothetical protein [Lysobacter sp. ISL-42]MBT2752108.1 hypothetical protein [Lysobacter sp. ISL-50]MBT2778605.1 hypothetical protein [Lysobacter sp. ISL-54]MBT2780464.1 hypothetical protein [Lysobacter sp. ISL-52]
MTSFKALGLTLALLLGSFILPGQAQTAPVRLPVKLFALLPEDFRHPESLAVNPANGDVFVGSFDARTPESSRANQILRLSSQGKLVARHPLGPTPITGLAFAGNHVYFLNFGLSRLQRLPSNFDENTTVEDVATFAALSPTSPAERHVANPDGSQDTIRFGSNGFPAINGLTFDRAGSAYVSDSFQGALYRISAATQCRPCTVEVISRDPLLATTGALPFGANGLALDPSENYLYVNNAGDGRVLRFPLGGGAPTILAESIHGADGLVLHEGLLWVAANQADAVVALDLNGREVARAGRFLGIAPDGSPQGLLFPAASAVIGLRMVVANLAMPLTAGTGDEWEEDVTRWNLMQFDLPKVHGHVRDDPNGGLSPIKRATSH